MNNLKVKPFKSAKYLKWVRTLPCSLCSRPADDAHHIIGEGMGGMGMKAPDNYTMPLCRGCHTVMHNAPELWPDQWKFIAKTQARWISEAQG